MKSIADSPIVKIIAFQFNLLIKFFDMAYKQGWLLYLVAGLIILVVIVWFF